ncbi:DUF123 domain-containing protein [Methanococcus voltae]|uniref:thymine-DNA glycosylase n=1 Tax=Methanococcus voltae (strain ATCC BAA-1334 / A3) TaxID=456320 RepID=D7DTR6_METV3|nr:DUF123 domain-containing protein [Methanococcus voltae]MCS3901380.1 endonuclease-3 [Methanococcus voltae]
MNKNNANDENFIKFLNFLRENTNKEAVVNKLLHNKEDLNQRAFKILLSTVISARTKDETTAKVSKKIFDRIKTPEDLINIDITELEEIVHPAGFYKTKSKNLKKLGTQLKEDYNNKVPNTVEELVKLAGVGRKTANLVVSLAFDNYAICVDTHVHRICNRWNYVSTDFPEETEQELRKKLPKKYWKSINNSLVVYGQDVCSPTPKCNLCYEEIKSICPHYSKLNTLKDSLNQLSFKKVSKTKIPKAKGTYVLKINLKSPKKIKIGKKGKEIKFRKGDYYYIGSAMGNSLNLYNRVNRHLSNSEDKNNHWHIDYLLEYGNVKEVYIVESPEECNFAKKMLKNQNMEFIEGFGCSDCNCKSHLFYIRD